MYYKKSIQGLANLNRPKRLSMRKKANHFEFSCLARLSLQEAELIVKSLLSADRIFKLNWKTQLILRCIWVQYMQDVKL